MASILVFFSEWRPFTIQLKILIRQTFLIGNFYLDFYGCSNGAKFSCFYYMCLVLNYLYSVSSYLYSVWSYLYSATSYIYIQSHLICIQSFPQCIETIHDTHIEIVELDEHYLDYINRKSYFSLNVQAVRDQEYFIQNVVIKWPGSVHDSRNFFLILQSMK